MDGEGSWALTCSIYIHLNPVRIRSLGQGKEERAREKEGFMQEVPSKAGSETNARVWRKLLAFDTVVKAVEQMKGEPWQDLADRRGDWGRDLVLYVARTRSGRTLAELGGLAGMSVDGVSKADQRMCARMSDDKKLNRNLRKVMRALDEEGWSLSYVQIRPLCQARCCGWEALCAHVYPRVLLWLQRIINQEEQEVAA